MLSTIVTNRNKILSYPFIYLFFQTLIGAKKARLQCVKEYVNPVPRSKILDIGCGPGYGIEFFPNPIYVGFDIDKKYINYAKFKYGNKGLFVCEEFSDKVVENLGFFDLVIMNGLLHHMSDNQVIELFEKVKRVLRSQGQIVTLDGCYVKGQSFIAKTLLDYDRGKFIRQEHDYVRLASKIFTSVVSHIRHDLMFIPYTLIVMNIS
ncbi:MAG: hypothetical protein A2W17_00925 [Planctomycetes bacterium RBG_16_41_13]|nr:MAG: hypothetical protein A2W17_00925 [Planctomycetes bacterium RBG_16_41_13]